MKTFSYVKSVSLTEEIEVGESYYFGELVNGDGDLDELLESGCVAIYDEEIEEERIVEFEIVENDENILDTVVKVTCII